MTTISASVRFFHSRSILAEKSVTLATITKLDTGINLSIHNGAQSFTQFFTKEELALFLREINGQLEELIKP